MGNEEDITDKKKPHRPAHSGRKAEKKAKKEGKVINEKGKNPKAFTFNSAVKAERRFRRSQDIHTKKQHIPLVDRTPVKPPPVIVAVVGPPKVGKSTLIQCLIKSITRKPLTNIKGPVTIVAGKKRRLTIMECNNDINCMIDIAKVADIVLLLVDASFGFEMEIFEFLNIVQVHGMPRIMGVLTHLDMLKHSKQLKTAKKTLKHRFWTEVYAGAKLFYLSGLLHEEYLQNEIKNLSRFISVMKFRPLAWRSSHPYILVDRLEDITSPEMIRQNPVVDRQVCLYGFVRGVPLNKKCSIHIPGCGDFKIQDVSFLPDPCPLPEKQKRRSLLEKEKCIYAPFSGVGGIVYDKDAVYVELGGSHSHSEENKPSPLVASLLEVQEPLDAKMSYSELQFFSGAEPVSSADFEGKSDRFHEEIVVDDMGRTRRKVNFTNNEVEDEEYSDSDEEDNENEQGDEDEDDSEFDEEGSEENASSEDDDETRNTTESKRKAEKKDNKKGGKVEGVHVNGFSKSNSNENVKVKKSSEDCRNGSVMQRTTKRKDIGNVKSPMKRFKQGISELNKRLLSVMGDDSDILDDSEEEEEEHFVQMNNKELLLDDEPTVHDSEIDDEPTVQDKPAIDDKPTKMIRQKSKPNMEITNKIMECLSALDKKLEKRSKDHPPFALDNFDVDDHDNEDEGESEEGVDERGSDESAEEIDPNSAESEDEMQGVEGSTIKWKSNLAERAVNAYLDRQTNSFSLFKLVYGQSNKSSLSEMKSEGNEEEGEEDVGGLFRKVSLQQKEQKEERDMQDEEDCSRFSVSHRKDWSSVQVKDSIRDCFVTGAWKESEDAEELLRLDDASISGDSDAYGDFEDLETGEKHVAQNDDSKEKKKGGKELTEKSYSKAELIEKKKKLKEKFDAEYDEQEGEYTYYDELKQEVSKQADLNKSEFEGMDDELRVQLEGFRSGMYVRVELAQVPCELITNFDATYPIIVGGLQTGEENVGYVQVRMKKHRWYSKILKNRDPLIVSLGWRRFQTLPVFAKLEDNLRHRMLKYTPEHVACIAHFWGPITPQATGFLAVQDVANQQPRFRIAATGSVVELDKSVQVMKKLKLTGVPLKIYKKTAFIRGMFNSSLEVAKFEGAKLRTVSGIRGQIKKAVNKPEGAFRATFEDKVVLSDIVFCRTWYRVEIPRLYNPVLSLLMPPSEKCAWQGMKTVGQLKREKCIKSEPSVDSLYTPIEREPKIFPKLGIPRSLQKALPYQDKPKKAVPSTKKQLEKKRIAVVRERHEREVAALMKRVKASYIEKQKLIKETVAQKKQERKKLLEKEELKLMRRRKELRREMFRTISKSDKEKEKRAQR